MENNFKPHIRKPIGVLVICVLIFLHFGVYQLIYDLRAMRQSEIETPLIIAIILFSFDVCSAAAAIWTFFGDNWGRISLLIVVTLNMLWSIFMLLINVAYAVPNASGYYDVNIFLFGFSLIRPIFVFGLTWWFCTRGDVTPYYKQNNEYEFF